MGEEQKGSAEADAKLEQEIRESRKFSLAEAIGRLAGPGMMKGASPATRLQQAEAEIESYLDRHLFSAAGALSVVLLRHVRESDLLLSNPDRPLVVLATCIQRVLDSEYLLHEFVREADVEWGQAYGERPYFEKEGTPPDADDPYTESSVRSSLRQLIETLATGGDCATKGHEQ
jgi:hypothetical protein